MYFTTGKLVQIAGWGGIIVATTGIYLKGKLIDRVRNFDYYRDALRILRRHPGAVHFLGEPIKDKKFKISDSENNSWNNENAFFSIPVSGPKDKGVYCFSAEKKNDKWHIVKAELEIKSRPDERLVIVKQN